MKTTPPPRWSTWRRAVFLRTPQTKNKPLFRSPAWGTRKNEKTIYVRSVSSILLGLDRVLKKIFRFSFVVLLCLRSSVLRSCCGTAQVTSQTQPDLCMLAFLGTTAQVTSHSHCCSTASQLDESCVLSTRDEICHTCE